MVSEVWSRFAIDPRAPEHAGLRAADRDRAVVEEVLGEAYAEGRLDRAEHDDLVARTASARTLGELPAILDGLVLPERPTSVPASRDLHAEAVQRYGSDRRDALMGFLGPSIVCWVIWAVVMGGSWGFPWPLFVMAGTGVNLLRVLVQRQDIIARHERELEKKERWKVTEGGRPVGELPPAPPPTHEER